MASSIERTYFTALRDATRKMLDNPFAYEWSIQGFGMLRCYLSNATRLHIWSKAHQKTSNIHDHPWDFTSIVLSGQIVDTNYIVTRHGMAEHLTEQPTHAMRTISCGPGGCPHDDVVGVTLLETNRTHHKLGAVYSLKHDDLHETKFSSGAVTIINRTFRENTEHARVVVPVGTEFEFIEPRPATREEVIAFVDQAIGDWEKQENAI